MKNLIFIIIFLNVVRSVGAQPLFYQRNNGLYDIVCADGSIQAQVSKNDLETKCKSKDKEDHIVVASFENSLETTFLEWGGTTWEGFASFEVAPSEHCGTYVVSAGDVLYPSSQKPTLFKRLVTPVQVRCQFSGQKATILNGKLEVTRFLLPKKTEAKFKSSVDSNPIFPGVYWNDFSGVALFFEATATFFNNFYAGKDCSQLVIGRAAETNLFFEEGANKQKVLISNSGAGYSLPKCVSSRLLAPENSTADFRFEISNPKLVNKN